MKMLSKYCGSGLWCIMLCVLLLSLCSVDVVAQRNGKSYGSNTSRRHNKNYSDHYFTTSVSGGYSLFLNNSRDITLVGGGGGALSVGYEFRKPSSRVWFSLAAEYQVLTSSVKLNYDIFDKWIVDSEGRLAMYHYDMMGGSDRQLSMAVSVPFMIGYIRNGFYIGAGPKLSYFCYGLGSNKLDYRTHATYDRYIDEYEDMPNHYYTTNSVNSGNMKMNFHSINVALCFETGYDVLNKIESKKTYWEGKMRNMDWIYVLKLGLYAEYGFLDINSNQPSGAVYSYNETNPFLLTVKPFYTTVTPTDLTLKPIYAGVKLTFMMTMICGRCRGKAKVF